MILIVMKGSMLFQMVEQNLKLFLLILLLEKEIMF